MERKRSDEENLKKKKRKTAMVKLETHDKKMKDEPMRSKLERKDFKLKKN